MGFLNLVPYHYLFVNNIIFYVSVCPVFPSSLTHWGSAQLSCSKCQSDTQTKKQDINKLKEFFFEFFRKKHFLLIFCISQQSLS